MVKGHNQEEGIKYDETFAPVTRLEVIWLLITFNSFMEFTMYKVDMASVFLNGNLMEEV